MKVFLLKINNRLLDLALPRIIMNHGGLAAITEAFAIVEECDRVLCQHTTLLT